MSAPGSFGRLITIEDIELFYTGAMGHPFVLHSDLVDIMKAAGTVTTETTGILNRVYGALIWSQLNQEANVFGALPKTTWARSGWRVKTAFAESTLSNIALTETSQLPNPVYPSIELVYAKPKIHAMVFDVTDVLEALATQSSDDVWGAAHQIRAEIGTEFIKHLNRILLAGSSVTNAFTSLNDVVDNSALIYNFSGSRPSWAQSVVNSSATLRPLTDTLIRDVLRACRQAGGNTSVIITGYDTYAALQGLYMTHIRWTPLASTKVQFGVNGVSTAAGLDAGIEIASLYGIPVIQSADVYKGTGSGEISYMYFLDTSDPEGYGFPRLSISILRPVEYFESRDYVLLNKFVIRGVYRIVGETTARFLPGQGKLRDITA